MFKHRGTSKVHAHASHVYVWALALLILGLAALFANKFAVANTSCAYGNCETVRAISQIVIPIGVTIFLAGLTTLIGNTLYLIFVIKRYEQSLENLQ